MDLWLNTIYKDERVKGSEIGPVAYIRNGSGDPLTSCSSLALRWGISKTTASRILARLDRLGYLNVLTFSGRHGTVLYLENYLSVMFQISDLPIHKEDVALRLQLKTGSPAEESCVPSEKISVSKRIMLELLPKLLQSLAAWGFFCCSCRKRTVKLYPLSAACDRWKLEVSCKGRMVSEKAPSRYCFKIRVTEGSGQSSSGTKTNDNELKGGQKMSVKDKRADGQPQEVEKMLDRMVSNRPAKIEEQPDLNKNWCFHNTKKLLQRYRSTLMCIAVALDDLDEECLGSLDVRFSAMGEFAQQMDIDLSGTYIESRLRTMQRNKLMLQYIDKTIKSMRAYAKNGEEFYWILYFKYLSSNEDICQTDGEVVEKLREKGLPVSSSTFYRRCNLAIDTLSGILWGFTARDTWSLVEMLESKRK